MSSYKNTDVRKEEIIRAALTIVERCGLDNLSLTNIAVEVGMVPSAIYRHFKKKEEIVTALIEFTDGCLKYNLSQADSLNDTVIAKLRLLFGLHVKLLKEEGAIPRILYFLLNSNRSPQLKAAMLSVVSCYIQQVRRILALGQEQGEISPGIDVAAAAMMFLGMVQPLAILSRVDKEMMDEYPDKLWYIYQRSITA